MALPLRIDDPGVFGHEITRGDIGPSVFGLFGIKPPNVTFPESIKWRDTGHAMIMMNEDVDLFRFLL